VAAGAGQDQNYNMENIMAMWNLLEIDEIRDFILENKIISAAVGWVIAISVAQTIQSAVGDIILPSVYFFIMYLSGFYHLSHLSKLSPIFEGSDKINIMRFLKEFISMVIVFIITFLVIKHLVYTVIPLQNSQKMEESVGVAAAPPAPTPTPNLFRPFY
jgi:large-conductance mechanosensitive channel